MTSSVCGSRLLLCTAALSIACAASAAIAQSTDAALPAVTVTETPSISERHQLPLVTESVTASQISEQVNAVNTEDALKYLPNVLIRKRHIGDTQAPMTTRTSGVGSSARGLIYADGVPLSALIGNNNSTASPRWGMVAPEEIERIDVMYGPFAAAYPGNSIGAVAEITTRMPRRFEAAVKVQSAWQSFSQYGTSDTYPARQASALLGNRSGNFSWWLSANHLDSYGQPLAYVTAARVAAPSAVGTPVTGAFADANRSGAPIAVLGAGGIERQLQDNFKLKLGYEVTPTLHAAYTIGFFQNDDRATAQTYLRDAAGNLMYSGSLNIGGYNYSVPASAFSNNVYRTEEQHWMHSLALRSDTRGTWDWEAVASLYRYGTETTRTPTAALPAALAGGAGTLSSMDGTGWRAVDLKGIWRPRGVSGAHQLSFGVHHDYYKLVNPKYNTANWIDNGGEQLAADARGKSQTEALWMQDVWRLAPAFKATLGGRYEHWRAFDGQNYSLAPALSVAQPGLDASHFSPKASLAFEASAQWLLTASLGKAYRFPTVTELYQAITTGATLSIPNPNLRPERAWSGELSAERAWQGGRVRASYFEERIADALISQTAPLVAGSATLFSYVQNIDSVRSRGLELVAQGADVFVEGLDLSGSVVYVHSRITADSAFAAAVGKQTPQVPSWRATLVATFRPNAKAAVTLAARYSDRAYATADNSDFYTHTYQGFDAYFVVDLRARYQIDRQWSAALGVDNLNNRKYFVFHPFPQRTALAELRFNY